MVTGSGPKAARWVPFTWVNTALGNIKTALAGTYHHVSAKHAQRYLTSFAWRFNRRYQLDTQVGLTAGTVFHWTKLPLTTWFLAIYHLKPEQGRDVVGRAGPPARHPAADGVAAQAQADGGNAGA